MDLQNSTKLSANSTANISLKTEIEVQDILEVPIIFRYQPGTGVRSG